MKKKSKIFIGHNLKQSRVNKKISLTELSFRSGVQLATLSRIEHNRMTGTLESHIAIANALGIHLENLYKDISQSSAGEPNSTTPILVDTFSPNDKAYYEIITKDVNLKKMLPLIIKIEGEGKTGLEQGMFGTEKFIYVLEGDVELVYGDHTLHIKKDNAFYIDASVDHFIKNPKSIPAKIICVRSPVKL